jgi:hypothetical protein
MVNVMLENARRVHHTHDKCMTHYVLSLTWLTSSVRSLPADTVIRTCKIITMSIRITLKLPSSVWKPLIIFASSHLIKIIGKDMLAPPGQSFKIL